ncbi:hypothetical protein AS850_02935 [Frondihabitans sp. 762G35]|uniref:hypothetical protein n=1 Tax=Frondihabitans sp. 762G35 TaxID=1446794 RepID=UPI000D214612|nr:hypothetical protein [Frondihabitans sp. 762G35]ARC56028.1 hypothetical protein AS850_02935 [Frondihabitans sp. 762G35]
MTTTQHLAEAERLLEVGRLAVTGLKTAHAEGNTQRTDELGKQATGIWLQTIAEGIVAAASALNGIHRVLETRRRDR